MKEELAATVVNPDKLADQILVVDDEPDVRFLLQALFEDDGYDIFSDYMKESKIKPRPGILRLLRELKEKKIRTGLVSSASKNNLNDLFINA